MTLIPDSVSTSQIGTLRIQFWREKILSALSLKPAAHPVPILLSHAIRTGAPLSQSWLLRLISSREQYLSNPPYPTLAALEQYAENTYSTLLYLTLSALPMTSLPADHLASHIGKATGIAAVLRGLPLLAFPPPPNHHSKSPTSSPQRTRQGTVPLPLDIMATAGLKEEDVLRHGSTAPGLRDAVFAVATRASDHLITARQMLKNLRAGNDVGHAYEHEGEEGHQYTSSPSRDLDVDGSTHQQVAEIEQAFGVLMPAVSTALWLERLESADFDVFHPALRAREWKLPWRAYWAYRRRMF